jgi:opacity protein-like surface antigen
MRIVVKAVVVAIVLALTPSISSAQDKIWHVNFGGGPVFLGGDLGDHFSTGLGPAIGVTVDANPNIAFQFEYAYRWFNIQDDAPFFGATRFDANHHMHQLDFNLVASLAPTGSAVRPYIVAGPGMYHRTVEITEYVGNGIICDPYWYVCGTYPVTDVVGSRGGWDFGFNVGGGVGFGLGESAEFYVEMKYRYVAGPEIEPNSTPINGTGQGGSTNGIYYPLTFGFRF